MARAASSSVFRGVRGAILAGGRARRLGGAMKPLLEVGGRRMIDRVRDALEPLCDELVVLGDAALLGDVGLPVVPDRRPGLGPLGGLETALEGSSAEVVLLVGGDMPFLERALLERLLAADASASAACFAGERGPEPLCARYAAALLPRVRARLDAGQLALHALLDEVGALRLPLYSPADRLALANVNTPDELAAARSRASLP